MRLLHSCSSICLGVSSLQTSKIASLILLLDAITLAVIVLANHPTPVSDLTLLRLMISDFYLHVARFDLRYRGLIIFDNNNNNNNNNNDNNNLCIMVIRVTIIIIIIIIMVISSSVVAPPPARGPGARRAGAPLRRCPPGHPDPLAGGRRGARMLRLRPARPPPPGGRGRPGDGCGRRMRAISLAAARPTKATCWGEDMQRRTWLRHRASNGSKRLPLLWGDLLK